MSFFPLNLQLISELIQFTIQLRTSIIYRMWDFTKNIFNKYTGVVILLNTYYYDYYYYGGT